jgi:hypothetical protein
VTSPFRRRIAVLALAVSVPALSACTNGFDNQTDAVYQPSVGVNDRSSEVDVLGAMVVAPEKGKDGVFIASLANNDQTTGDKLTAVDAQGAKATLGDVPPIPAGGLVNLASEEIGGVPVTGAAVKPGGYVLVRLTFANADPVTVKVPVVVDEGPYASITPKPSSSASPSGSPSASPSPSSSPSGSATP